MHPLLILAAILGGGYYFLKGKSTSSKLPLLSGGSPAQQAQGGTSAYHPTAYQQDAANFPAGSYVVSTQTDPLNLRGDPSTDNQPVGLLPKGGVVTTNGVVENGFTGIIGSNGTQIGWAATEFLTPTSDGIVTAPDPSGVTAGFVGAAVNVALQTQRCLNKLGCNPPLTLSGHWDQNTQQCIADFQHQHGLSPTGQIDFDTRQILQGYCS